ncbi:MAG: type II secretion system protein [Gammaproteobacteria bacterium]
MNGQMSKNNSRGFTLVELMIVAVIMITIAAMALPALLRARLQANEANAAGAMKVIVKSQVAYALAFNTGYSADLYSLGPTGGGNPSAGRADLVDEIIAGSVPGSLAFTKAGYLFTYTPQGAFPNVQTFTLTAAPAIPGSTGRRYFYADQTLIIRGSTTGPAGSGDSPIPN